MLSYITLYLHLVRSLKGGRVAKYSEDTRVEAELTVRQLGAEEPRTRSRTPRKGCVTKVPGAACFSCPGVWKALSVLLRWKYRG